jgi:hypothetical protein
LAIAAYVGMMLPVTGQIKVFPFPYEAASYISEPHSHSLRIFPFNGNAITIPLPFPVDGVTFAPDGKAIYGFVREDPFRAGLSKIEFNPIRTTTVPGTLSFIIQTFAISSRQDKVAASGIVHNQHGNRCGLFEILIPNGSIRQILNSECNEHWACDNISLSPNGERAIARIGNSMTHDFHLEQIDLVHGTTKSLGEQFSIGVWSPDGKWIAAREKSQRDKLFLVDSTDFSHRRDLGGAIVMKPAWSPDSRYLLLWKSYLFRCGIYPDLEPPLTLETLDIQSGKKSTIRSSRCQVTGGPTGWVSSEFAH